MDTTVRSIDGADTRELPFYRPHGGEGAICYLDEVVEARKDTTAVLHPLTDDRRGAVSDESVGVAVFIPQASSYGAAVVAT